MVLTGGGERRERAESGQRRSSRWPAAVERRGGAPVDLRRREAGGCARLDLVKLTAVSASPVSVPARRKGDDPARRMAAWSMA
jgi:hypothetical protein